MATLEEVYQLDAGIEFDTVKTGDIAEIANYRRAIAVSETSLKDRPLTLSFVRHLHAELLQGVRGQAKDPGQFRKDQNWIGKPGCGIENARFVPPDPIRLLDYLENWEAYLSNEEVDPILQVALAHAQFEIIHPFKDGNGRIGRILIPLLMYRRGLLQRPMFYLSEYLEERRQDYYDFLLAITSEGDWNSWVLFFCDAVKTQAIRNNLRVANIFQLYQELKIKFADTTGSKHAVASLDAFFNRPIINSSDFFEEARIDTRVTSNSILNKLWRAKLISKLREGSGRQPAIFALESLIQIAENA